jgi:acyl-CoA hydrolase
MSKINYKSAEEALKLVQSNHRVFVHGSAMTPTHLLNALAKEASRLQNVELVSITLQGEVEAAKPIYKDSFFINSLFVSTSIREAVRQGQGDYVPIFLSDIPELFKDGILPLDVALIQVSPPDLHGFCSLGVSVDIARAAVSHAKTIIAQVNPHVPRTHGDSMVHYSRFEAIIYVDTPLHEANFGEKVSTAELKIGEYVAGLIDDRCTLQMGIGAIPDAVLQSLTQHKDLGIHTEMFSDGLIPLLEKGVVTNKYKKVHPNKVVTGFALGSKKLYNYVHDNPEFAFLDIDYVNDTSVIRRNPNVVAINSAVEIDVTGQVCADSIGTYQFSGVGGQMDFIRGAALSAGGKPIIALPSRTNKGISRIVPFLKQGAGVVTTRAHVHYVVTEYGVAYLFGKNLSQRAKALIEIAHPDDRETLEIARFERFKN